MIRGLAGLKLKLTEKSGPHCNEKMVHGPQIEGKNASRVAVY